MSRRDRLATLTSLAGFAVVAWIYLWWDTSNMAGMAMPEAAMSHGGMAASGSMGGQVLSPWRAEPLFLTFLMW